MACQEAVPSSFINNSSSSRHLPAHHRVSKCHKEVAFKARGFQRNHKSTNGRNSEQCSQCLHSQSTSTVPKLPRPTQMATKSFTSHRDNTRSATQSRNISVDQNTSPTTTVIVASPSVLASSSIAPPASTPLSTSSASTPPAASANSGMSQSPQATPLPVCRTSAGPAQAPSTERTGQPNNTAEVQCNGSTNQTSSQSNKNPSYQSLGIITERPKKPEFAVRDTRLASFASWPKNHHQKKEDLAGAGFHYAGYGDCARCFFCGGGLRNWDPTDNVWVEHARWFPKCAYLRQTKGQPFIDAVKRLSDADQDVISYQDALTEMGRDSTGHIEMVKVDSAECDPAVKVLEEEGFEKADVMEAVRKLRADNLSLSVVTLLEKLSELGKQSGNVCEQSLDTSGDSTPSDETLNKLREENHEMRRQLMCKVCWESEVSVAFLPCGHMVCCSQCAPALQNCPICRQNIRGIVRTYLN